MGFKSAFTVMEFWANNKSIHSRVANRKKRATVDIPNDTLIEVLKELDDLREILFEKSPFSIHFHKPGTTKMAM